MACDASAYFAHSTNEADRRNWQPLAEHLMCVGALASQFAATFGAQELASVAGKLHDLGKYTQDFQRRLAGEGQRTDHSTWGARVSSERYGPLGKLLAYAIAGHHAGLANGQGEGERTPLADRLTSNLPALDSIWQREIDLPKKLAQPDGFRPYGKDGAQARERFGFQLSFLVRMLFSCLVDADFLDTAAFYDRVEGCRSLRGAMQYSLEALRKKLDIHLGTFQLDSDVNRLRADVLRHVRAGAACSPGLFSLTVPTGGGKTLASLAFALDHAIRHGLHRVIFVIPFTSIVEQNAAVFRHALGELGAQAVLEHHSAFVDDPHRSPEARDKLRLAMENWDAPIVVTTAVQFFESLFAARPAQCRKLHRIAGSVVIFDEAQTLPLKVLRPCVAALDELARNYRSSVVLCTATQPALNAPAFAGGLENVRELAPRPADLFRQLERVRVRYVGPLTDDALVEVLKERDQTLCIVNNRRHARALYEAISHLPGSRHLTTLMCAKHRSDALGEVRQRLKDNQPCRLISTSLIEAGVDVDFPFVLRAEAGLDSIAQAAGRCNREGRRARDASEVWVFEVAHDEWSPPPELKQFAQAGREVLRHHSDDPLAPDAIERYFRLLYWQKGEQQLDVYGLLNLARSSQPDSLPLETLAARFRMIDSVQMPVIVPWQRDSRINRALEELRHVERCGAVARQLQPYVVQVPQQGWMALLEVGAIQPVAPERWGEQFMVLVNEDLYDDHVGLHWENPQFVRAEGLTW